MRRWAFAVTGMAALLLAACSAPTRAYVAGNGMFFALPREWTAIPTAQLRTAESGWKDDAGSVFTQSVLWQGAWAAGSASANDVFASAPPSHPVVFAFSRTLAGAETQGIGKDLQAALRDVVIPASLLTDAEVQTERISRNGFSGIHQFATYPSGGRMQSVEVVSMLSPGKQRVHVLAVRCSEKCFTANSGAINAIIDSLTFREQRG